MQNNIYKGAKVSVKLLEGVIALGILTLAVIIGFQF